MSFSLPMRQSIALETPAGREDTDVDLVEQAQHDPRAFALLYGKYLDPVHQYCYRRLSSREAAEDATSQVFIQALAGLPKFSSRGGSFRAWLFTIAHNVVIDQYRASRPSEWLDTEMDLPDESPSPEELAVAADAGRSLRQAVEHLPERQRQVVELRLAGLTAAEIGQVLGCRARTVDVAQFRAVARLRTLMGVTVQPKGGRDA
jgi:RNA polymerase sigma-70 factor (ECF subfamily)